MSEQIGISALPTSKKHFNLGDIDDASWNRANQIKQEVDRLLADTHRTEKDVSSAATRLGMSSPWLYVLLRRHKESDTVSDYVKTPPTGGKGLSRIDPTLEEIISQVIETFYLTVQKPRPFLVVREVKRLCRQQNLNPPSANTIRSRLKSIPAGTVTKRRESGHKARDLFDPVVGEFPQPTWPLGVIQMDHTVTDIVIVDEIHREPIGRATCTAAIDLYSRAIVGFHLSLEAPSALSVGLCLTHAVLPKVKWLKERGLEVDWPMWGKPDVLHVDNGSDFRSDALKRGCQEHGISLQHRPIKHPRYGGTIERLFRTLTQEMHAMPGATFSNVAARGEYDSNKNASLTLAELESALTHFITGVYHERPHGTTLVSPRIAFERGISGYEDQLGRGTPTLITDEQGFLIDFLPVERRSIQKYGFVWDHVHYYDDVLRPYIDRREKRKFTVRRDPRDISKIFFFCPETKQYYEIPYRNISRPTLSLWEVKAARERLKRQGEAEIDEEKIFRSYDTIQSELDAATNKTKSARRTRERKRQVEISVDRNPARVSTEKSEISTSAPSMATDVEMDQDDRFDDIEHW